MADLKYLREMAFLSVQGLKPNEYDAYGLITEAFIYHKKPYDRYTIFPQHYLQWKPNEPNDHHGTIPDFVLGHYIRKPPYVQLQGGAEVKRAQPKMKELPDPDTVASRSDLQIVLYETSFQARDQAVCAVKEGRLPNKRLKWLIFIGPYFAEIGVGPFSEPEQQTRTHKPNPSGDLVESVIAKMEKKAAPFYVPLYLLGTDKGAKQLEDYIEQTNKIILEA